MADMDSFARALVGFGQGINGRGPEYLQQLEIEKQKSALAQLAPRIQAGDKSALVELAMMNPQAASTISQLSAPKSEVKEIDGRLVRYNPNDMNAKPEVIYGGNGVTPKTVQGEGDLRKEFDSQTKDYRVVSDAYNKIQKSSGDPSAAGDLALIFSYMKLLDPGSTVREGEFATAQNAAGIPTQIQNLWNRANTGERLSPEQRADFLRQAQNLFDAQGQNYNASVTKYRDLASSYGYDPERIVKPAPAQPKKPLSELSTEELLAKLRKK